MTISAVPTSPRADASALLAFWLRQTDIPSSSTTATARPISAGRPYSSIHLENCLASSLSCTGAIGACSGACGSVTLSGVFSSMGGSFYGLPNRVRILAAPP